MATVNAYTGKTKDGKFIPDDRAAFVKAFLRKDGTPMVVTAKRLVPKRSNRANAFWWAVVVPMFMDESGIRDKSEMHHIILEEIGHYDLVRFGKKEKKVVKDTHDLGSDEFATLIDAAGQLFAEMFGGYIPPPNSQQAEAMMAGS
jgi:hypothetical protein